MSSRNSLIQIPHRLTSACTLLAVLTTFSLPAFAQSISSSDMLARRDLPDASMPTELQDLLPGGTRTLGITSESDIAVRNR